MGDSKPDNIMWNASETYADAAHRLNHEVGQLQKEISRLRLDNPVPMLLWCPDCGYRHIDAGEFATKIHHTHACQSCGLVWRPAIVATRGVQFLPGFKNEPATPQSLTPSGQTDVGTGGTSGREGGRRG